MFALFNELIDAEFEGVRCFKKVIFIVFTWRKICDFLDFCLLCMDSKRWLLQFVVRFLMWLRKRSFRGGEK